MDGLIPFLFHAMKKHGNNNNKPHHHHHRRSMSFSEGSTRSYHLLVQPDSFSGSSHHRRTRSEFQMPTPAATAADHFSGQHDLLRTGSLRKRHANHHDSPVSITTAAGGAGESKYAVAGSIAAAGNVNVNDGRGAMHGGH
ncbi:unnamed protein product [Linum tenue]|uniref:Uncharacterized protein n=1 Tax=Linum tenue TaxID=586396 RepID=A0AAV0PMD9_9ROSI|nr:unnamed protein product [Linum tenue]